ncbi:hypothetical protein B0T21DRAFT_388390 [Apiosordaria backusii]|uniref:Uncharacterized protein n=1 Tax=Apiosordaria backusii TaxID=314023 RepID=A0AA40EXM4_9PEZI|nr:hypothetical protein B0T21DRAFT_388390 [Apiosordaria backusii]
MIYLIWTNLKTDPNAFLTILRASLLPLRLKRCRSGESESGESESGESESGESESGESESGESESGESESGESESGESESGEMEAVGLKALHRTNIQKSAFNCVSLSEVLDRVPSSVFFQHLHHQQHLQLGTTALTASQSFLPQLPQAYQRYKPLWATEPMEVVGSDKEENEVFNAHKGASRISPHTVVPRSPGTPESSRPRVAQPPNEPAKWPNRSISQMNVHYHFFEITFDGRSPNVTISELTLGMFVQTQIPSLLRAIFGRSTSRHDSKAP